MLLNGRSWSPTRRPFNEDSQHYRTEMATKPGRLQASLDTEIRCAKDEKKKCKLFLLSEKSLERRLQQRDDHR